jgi:hypothetical protein
MDDARLMTALFMGLTLLRLLGDEGVEQREEPLLDRIAVLVTRGIVPAPTDEAAP